MPTNLISKIPNIASAQTVSGNFITTELRPFLTIFLSLSITLFCEGQSHKIILGINDSIKFNEPLKDGQWLLFTSDDMTHEIQEINYKNKMRNGCLVHYQIMTLGDKKIKLIKSAEYYEDNHKLRTENWQYYAGRDYRNPNILTSDTIYSKWPEKTLYYAFSSVTYYSKLKKRIICDVSGTDNKNRIQEKADSTIVFEGLGNRIDGNRNIRMKGYYNKCGRKEGKWTFISVGGELDKVEEYKDGELIEYHDHTGVKFYTNGQLIKTIDGTGTKTYKDGKIIKAVGNQNKKNYH